MLSHARPAACSPTPPLLGPPLLPHGLAWPRPAAPPFLFRSCAPLHHLPHAPIMFAPQPALNPGLAAGEVSSKNAAIAQLGLAQARVFSWLLLSTNIRCSGPWPVSPLAGEATPARRSGGKRHGYHTSRCGHVGITDSIVCVNAWCSRKDDEDLVTVEDCKLVTRLDDLSPVLGRERIHAPGDVAGMDTEHQLGLLPHQMQRSLSNCVLSTVIGNSSNNCTACSNVVLSKYKIEGLDFIMKAINQPTYLKDLTGICNNLIKSDIF